MLDMEQLKDGNHMGSNKNKFIKMCFFNTIGISICIYFLAKHNWMALFSSVSAYLAGFIISYNK